MATTPFESFTHQQMRDMIASLDPASVQARADQLTKAADDIRKIGEALKRHRVTGWEGEGADAFEEWVGRAGNATLRLGEYSATGGKWIGSVVQLMTEATKMTAVDKTATKNLEAALSHPNDPDAPTARAEAQTILDADHREAVRLMTNLAQSYRLSSDEMNKAQIPTFPPPPSAILPPDLGGTEDMQRSGGTGAASGGGSGSAGSSYTQSGGPSGAPSGEPGWSPGRQPQPDNTVPSVSVPGIPDRDVDVDLDSVATLPDRTTPPVTTPVGPQPTGPGPIGPTPGPFVPPVGLPPVGGVKGLGPGGTGPILGPYPGLTGPSGSGGKVGGMPPGMLPRDTGIMGGRPVTSTGPSSGIPRGTVIGEGTQAGRPMGGGGMGPGVGGGHGSPAGRRLASEPGGVVGGRQSGVVGRPIASGQPFTQGGSGLVRNGAGGTGVGAMGHAGAAAQAPGRRREDQRGERPDYLAEDEETWQGNRRVVPPVID